MNNEQLPFKMPESMASYVEQYHEDPQKTIDRFEKQLQRRGKDAVGYFLLGWFYLKQGKQKKAVECAVKAKTLAPGSPFMQKVHYFFSHPDLFDAWQRPDSSNGSSAKNNVALNADLNALIDKLSQVDQPIKIDPDHNEDIGQKSTSNITTDDIASETLAKVHEQQDNYETAINMYQTLKTTNADKADEYDEKIKALKKQLAEAEKE